MVYLSRSDPERLFDVRCCDREIRTINIVDRNCYSCPLYASSLRHKARAQAVRGILRSMVELSDHGDLMTKFLSLPFRRMFMYGEQNASLSYLPRLLANGVQLAEVQHSGHFPMYSNLVQMWEQIAAFVSHGGREIAFLNGRPRCDGSGHRLHHAFYLLALRHVVPELDWPRCSRAPCWWLLQLLCLHDSGRGSEMHEVVHDPHAPSAPDFPCPLAIGQTYGCQS
jgi:hypothetical protein